jgi:hypothetical protein
MAHGSELSWPVEERMGVGEEPSVGTASGEVCPRGTAMKLVYSTLLRAP